MSTLAADVSDAEFSAIRLRASVRSGPTVFGVQYVRAAAAAMVVYFHIFSTRVASGWGGGRVGEFGVDLFFVVSGFVMWRTTADAGRATPGAFLFRRATRVYPPWWVALAVWIGIRMIVPDRLHGADVTRSAVVTSFLLVPNHHEVFRDRIWPILVPGWTLQIELLFYLIFGLLLLIGGKAARLAAVTAILGSLSAIGLWSHPREALAWTLFNPLLLEFAIGLALGFGFERLPLMPRPLSLALIVAGVLLVFATIHAGLDDGVLRGLTLGPAAGGIMAGLLSFETRIAERPIAPLLLGGDASYSLYLTHPISVSAAAVVWEKLHLPMGPHPDAMLFIPAALVAAFTGALVFYRAVELPLLQGIRRLRGSRTGNVRLRPLPACPAPASRPDA